MSPARSLWLLAVAALLTVACGGEGGVSATPEGTPTPAAPTSTPATDRDGPFRILALGDSYTIGERVPRAESWPLQLRAVLRADGVDVDEPLVMARTGWTTDDLIRATEASTLPEGPYDLVTLLIGVNNEFQGWLVEDFRPELALLMARALAFAGGQTERVIVISIPDYGVTPALVGLSAEVIGASIDRYNAVVEEEAQRFGLEYVDITEISREAADDLSLIAPDNLHPSGAMYARWVELLAPIVGERFASLGALSGGWSASQLTHYENEVALRRHP